MENPTPDLLCAVCSRPLVSDALFCAFCGTRIVETATLSAIDTLVQNKLNLELKSRLEDQKNIVREIGDRAEDVVWQRLKRYGVISAGLLAVIFALITFIGINTLEGVSKRIEPVIKDAEQRASAVKQTIDATAGKTAALRTALEKLSEDVEAQSNKVSDKSGEITEKLDHLDATANDTQQKWEAARVHAEQLSSRLDAMERSLENKVAQVSKQVDNVTIRQAYPTLGQQKYVTLQGQRWKDKSEKGATERWINIWIDADTIGDISQAQLEELIKSLREIGYTSFLGFFGIGGPYSGGFGPATYEPGMAVSFFQSDLKDAASEVTKLASRILSKKLIEPRYVDPSKLKPEDKRFVYENAGLDMQLYLNSGR